MRERSIGEISLLLIPQPVLVKTKTHFRMRHLYSTTYSGESKALYGTHLLMAQIPN